jgi:hypothetical protein
MLENLAYLNSTTIGVLQSGMCVHSCTRVVLTQKPEGMSNIAERARYTKTSQQTLIATQFLYLFTSKDAPVSRHASYICRIFSHLFKNAERIGELGAF